jgi:hypothetical protein
MQDSDTSCLRLFPADRCRISVGAVDVSPPISEQAHCMR